MQKYEKQSFPNIVLRSQNELDFKPHLHEDIELVYVKNGEGEAVCDGKKSILKNGDFFLAFPNQIHSYEGFPRGDDYEYYCLIIKPSQLSQYTNFLINYLPHCATCHPADKNIQKLFEIAINEYTLGAEKAALESLLSAFFGLLLQYYELKRTEAANDKFSEVLLYCSKHFKEEIRICDISKSLYISRSYISHMFNGKLGIGFNDYINQLRVSEAMHFLELGNHSVTDIAFLSGFSTLRTFYRAFKKVYNTTPSEYKKNRLS